ncbi:hypothetical protein [Herbaspirillum sp. YR522]|uniref:hypothetical protein n=1 Tax=Herbaspirillum sp. YR522 TaxID=1144342 RepID=UPI00026FBC8C|nr:hypothetical protein [Herbaspirillum sp. YR522]EJM97766.1 hypothetical protein PMI40_04248 [Herbaspirillum sp. YR522]
MHDQASGTDIAGGHAAAMPCLSAASRVLQRRARHVRRWCGVGFVMIPFVQAFVWSQYNSIVTDGGVLVGEDYCACRATVARWVSDYFWTQMIWLPANTLVLLIWGALAFKLWGRHFGPRPPARR